MVSRLVCIALITLLSATGYADPPPDDDKPFAEQHILLQLSEVDPARQAMALDVASNVIKHYGGPDNVAIQVLGFGPGVHLFSPDNPLRERIESLMVSGVQFVVCDNTLDTIERVQGKRPAVLDGVYHVQTGVAFMAEQAGRGWVLVRP